MNIKIINNLSWSEPFHIISLTLMKKDTKTMYNLFYIQYNIF